MSRRKSAAVRKAEMTQAAMELAFEFGPDRVTTAMIAERLGLTQPAIYKHFPNKNDIWHTATDELCRRIDDNILAAEDEADPIARLRALVLGQLRLLHDYPALPEIMVMHESSADTKELRTRVLGSMGGLRQAIFDAMSAAQAAGRIRPDLDVEDCTSLLVGMVQGLALRLLRFREPEALLGTGKRLLELQLQLLTNRDDA